MAPALRAVALAALSCCTGAFAPFHAAPASRRRPQRPRAHAITRRAAAAPSSAPPPNAHPTKYIFVTGGVLSGIGKGVTASSVGVIMRMMGLRPTALKIDPYLNIDAGTMSPLEHGEVFVLDDGGETDLDLGNYERFMGISLTNSSNLTTGKAYRAVIEKERLGEYLGKTVQVVPHVTDLIQQWIVDVAKTPVEGDSSGAPPDVCVIELGGTVGDMESMPFIEAIRQLRDRVGYKNCALMHVSLVPLMASTGEQKTKPTQHSVKELRALGLHPDFVVCRSETPVNRDARDKLSCHCQVAEGSVISVHDVSNIYRVPQLLLEQNIAGKLGRRLRLGPYAHMHEMSDEERLREPRYALDEALHDQWLGLANTVDRLEAEAPVCRIALVGKYVKMKDAYQSVVKALNHAAIATSQKLQIEWVEAEHLEAGHDGFDSAWERVRGAHGVLVPGGFGDRGAEGKVAAIGYARTERTPFLGVCLGMQLAVVEYARAELGLAEATSEEFAPAGAAAEQHAVVFMPEGDRRVMGGTMRLGARDTALAPGSLLSSVYGDATEVSERHRHRYEVNPGLVGELEAAGLVFSGRNRDADLTGERMEAVELATDDHPFFVGVQFHPEYKSRPSAPAPLFRELLAAAAAAREAREREAGAPVP